MEAGTRGSRLRLSLCCDWNHYRKWAGTCSSVSRPWLKRGGRDDYGNRGWKYAAVVDGATESALAENLSPKLLKKAAQSDREQVNRWLTVLGQKGISDRVADKVCGLLKEDGVGVIAGA